MNNIPELEAHCGSWVVTDPHTNRVVEFFSRKNAEVAAANGWLVETAAQYLARLNAAIRAG